MAGAAAALYGVVISASTAVLLLNESLSMPRPCTPPFIRSIEAMTPRFANKRRLPILLTTLKVKSAIRNDPGARLARTLLFSAKIAMAVLAEILPVTASAIGPTTRFSALLRTPALASASDGMATVGVPASVSTTACGSSKPKPNERAALPNWAAVMRKSAVAWVKRSLASWPSRASASIAAILASTLAGVSWTVKLKKRASRTAAAASAALITCDSCTLGVNFDTASALAVSCAGVRLSTWAPASRIDTDCSLPATAAACSASMKVETRFWKSSTIRFDGRFAVEVPPSGAIALSGTEVSPLVERLMPDKMLATRLARITPAISSENGVVMLAITQE